MKLSPDLERELVEWVNLVEVVQDEVEQGGTSSSWTVALPCLVNLLLCYFRLRYLRVTAAEESNGFSAGHAK